MDSKWAYTAIAGAVVVMLAVIFRETFIGFNTGGIPVPETPFPKDVVLAMADEFKETLRDPYSAIFSETRTGYKSGKYGVCGLVNAKNAYGALTGDSFYKMEISINDSKKYSAYLQIGRPDQLSRLEDSVDAIREHPCYGFDKLP